MRKLKILCLLTMATTVLTTGCTRNNCRRNSCIVDETYVHKYGVPVAAQDWTTRGENGKVITTMNNGIVITKSYVNGVLEGESTYSHPHSDLIERVQSYSNGVLTKEVVNDLAGHPKQEIQYSSAGVRFVTTWFEGGAPESKETYQGDFLRSGEYYTDANKVEARVDDGFGSRLNRDVYGNVVSIDDIQKGQIVSQTAYHPNGVPSEVATFRNGKIEGIRRTYLPAGEPESVEEWVNGSQHGMTTIYRNGEKYAVIPFEYGRKNGIERHYRDGDTLVEEIAWVNDLQHGPKHTYVGGKVVNTEWYYNGALIPKNSEELNNSRSKD